MKYEELFDDFMALFPEYKDWLLEKCENEQAFANDGMHIVFGMVIVPFILTKIVDDSENMKKAFGYIEKMENSGDVKIAEVVEFSILEGIIGSDNNKLKKCIENMGPETKKAYEDVKKGFNN